MSTKPTKNDKRELALAQQVFTYLNRRAKAALRTDEAWAAIRRNPANTKAILAVVRRERLADLFTEEHDRFVDLVSSLSSGDAD